MKYQRNKGRGKGHSFIMLRHDMIDSAAWRSLSCNARCVWLEVVRRYNGYNNGSIPMSCREAGKLCGFSQNTAGRAFKELEDAGFLKVGIYAGFRNKHRVSTRWVLTHERLDDKKPSNEWKLIDN